MKASDSIDDKVAWAIGRCREQGLRRTKALEELLGQLIREDRPLSLAELADSDALRNQCDKATVYRLVTRLEERGVVRRVGLPERASYFTILYPEEHHDYLICTECGSIDKLDIACPVSTLEREISEKSGFTKLYHELEFFGVCPQCG